MFSKYSASSFGSPLHHLAAAAALSPPFTRIILSRQSPLSTSTAAALSPPFTRIILYRQSRLSTSTAGNDRPTVQPEAENTCTMADFLLNECGVCQSEVSTMFRIRPSLVGRRSTHTAQETVQFLRGSGFTEDQVRKLITKSPSILELNADRQLKPKIEFLKTLRLTPQDSAYVFTEDQVRKMIIRTPGFIHLNVDRQLKPKIDFMKTFGLTAQDLGTAISRLPNLLYCSLEKTLRPNIQYLQNLFGSEAYVSRVFKFAPEILVNSKGPDYFEKKMKHLGSFGLLENEIKDLVRKNPRTLNVSMEKVQKNMDFFIHTAGLPPKFLLTNTSFLGYSLECRIKPRYKVLDSISAMQPSERLPSLISALYLTEGKFLEKYVECSPHATKLLEIYSSKPVDLDVIQ